MTEKQRVLAKCGEIVPKFYDSRRFGFTIVERTSSKVRIIASWGVVYFSENIPENDPVWPLAAKILGIGDEEQAELRFVCKVGLGTAKAGNFMYHVIKWNVKVLSSICVGCKQYTKGQMSRGQAEVMLEFRDSK
mgnify:CR=1 FL=1